MSALTGSMQAMGPDGVGRYRTKLKIIINSHQTDKPIDVSASVISYNSSKNIKSVGQLSFALVGDQNWFNVMYPNDYVNMYIDRADGNGWVRTFFGFIDHIEQTVAVQNGRPTTIYSVQCSDFQKAFERTQIYFNPHVAAREDFRGGFIGTPNIGGLALMTRGIRMNGSPADLVLNVVLLLMGFGSQFILPTSYNPLLATRIRKQRADFILNKLSEDARRQVLDAGGYAEFLEQQRSQQGITTDTLDLINPDSLNVTDIQRAEQIRFSNEVIKALGSAGSGVSTESHIGARERGVEAYNILNTTVQGYPPTLLDVIDVFTFVERSAIDGYTIGAPMWEHQGSVMSFLRSISNEVVNELFFDLRPMSRGGGLVAGTGFSKDRDDIGGNLASDGVPTGIQYLPAMVMREYPFSTVHSVDASDVSLTIRQSVGSGGVTTSTQGETLGLLHFGAIFSANPNIAGRHIVRIPNINPEDKALGTSTEAATKHIDVVVVRDHEIEKTRFSRSDTDHYNVFEFYSNALLGQDARFFMQDLLPIITPIHIIRHGLRVRSLTTRFGRFSLDVVNRIQPQSPPASEEQPEEATPEAPASSPRYVSPVEYVAPNPSGRTWEERRGTGMIAPGNIWHYRRRPNPSTELRDFNNRRIVPPGNDIWRFHHGVDYVASEGTPVYAVTDGWVVAASSPDSFGGVGGFSGYGGTVIIYHGERNEDHTTPDGSIFSLYAHLSKIEPKFLQGSGRTFRSKVSKEIQANGQYEPVRVRAGEKIGEVGSTGFRDRNMGAHLHFEILKKRNNRIYPARDFPSRTNRVAPDILTSDSQLESNGGWAPAGSAVSVSRPSSPREDQSISQDPVRVLREWGVPVYIHRPGEVPPEMGGDTDIDYDGDANEGEPEYTPGPAPSAEIVDTAEESAGQSTEIQVGHVDTPSTRQQIARWALLNDHWYQHNLEYLSGTIEMRGAPEIRVGYRLDLIDRNMSFYVEGVSHSWTYGGAMKTTLHVTRGQPNNPYPSYVLPRIEGFTPTETQRQTGSRLSKYFIIPDPISVKRALKVWLPEQNRQLSPITNEVDVATEGATLSEKYEEHIQEADVVTVSPLMEEALTAIETPDTFGTSTTAVETNPMGGMEDFEVPDDFGNMG